MKLPLHARWAIALLCVAFALPAGAQTTPFIPFYQTGADPVMDASGHPLASGQVIVTPVNAAGVASSFRAPSGGQVVISPVVANVTDGTFSMTLPDVAGTNPVNMQFSVEIVDNASGDVLLGGPGSGYDHVQPSETASYATGWCSNTGCDFGKYIPQSPALAPITETGNITNNYGAGEFVNIANFPGADIGAQLHAADAAYVGQPAIFAVLNGGTLSTATTLSAQHALEFYAPVSFAATITPTTDNSIRCMGANVVLTNGMASADASADSFFAVPAGGSEAQRVTIRDCHFEGNGGNNDVFYSALQTADIALVNNYVHSGELYKQQSANASNPSQRLLVSGNHDIWNGANGNEADVLVYGALIDSLITGNEFYGGKDGAQLYFSDASVNPSYATVMASGLRNDIFSHNTCEQMGGTCAWGAEMYKVSFLDNTATGCGDVCFDAEGSALWLAQGNTATGGVNGDFTTFYTGYQNAVIGNQIVSAGENGISVRNSSYAPASQGNMKIAGNTFTCPNSNSGADVGCPFGYFEANQGMTISGNNITNGTLAYGASAYVSRQSILNNLWMWTVAVPYSYAGGVLNGGAGILAGNFQDGNGGIVAGNTVITAVSQSYPCLSGGLSQPNFAETLLFLGNTCQGWTTDAAVNSSSVNPATVHNFVFRNNQWSTGTITSTGSPVNVIKTNNYVGASATPSN